MTSMDDDRWVETGSGPGYAHYVRECNVDEPADTGLTLRWSYNDLVAEHGEQGAGAILADLVDAWETNGGQPVTADQIDAAALRRKVLDE